MASLLDYYMNTAAMDEAAKRREESEARQRERLAYTPGITPTERALLMGTQGRIAPQVLQGANRRNTASHIAALLPHMSLTPAQQNRLMYGHHAPGASGAVASSVFNPPRTVEDDMRLAEHRAAVNARYRQPTQPPMTQEQQLALYEKKKAIDAKFRGGATEASADDAAYNETMHAIEEAIGLTNPATTGAGGFVNRLHETATGAFTGEQGPALRLEQITDELAATNWRTIVGPGQISKGDYVFLDKVLQRAIASPAEGRVKAFQALANRIAAEKGKPLPYPRSGLPLEGDDDKPQEMPRPQSREAVDALAPGTRFVAPDGSVRVR